MRIIHESIAANKAELIAYLPDNSREMPNIKARPAVLVFPGGGYAMCSEREGEPIALAYLAHGFSAFVLHYSADAKTNAFPKAFEDAKAALHNLRENAKEYGIDPDKIAVAGFSAGGHLAACLGTMAAEKPNALVLGYPVILSQWGKNFGRELPGADEAVTKETPPTFIFATQADRIVPIENSIAFCAALARVGVSFEQHIYLDGVHGASLCTAATSGGKAEAVNEEMAAWLPMSVCFLHKLWGDFALIAEGAVSNQGKLIDTPISQLLENEKAAKMIESVIPGIRDHLMPGLSLSLRRIAQFSEGTITEQKLNAIEEQLRMIMCM